MHDLVVLGALFGVYLFYGAEIRSDIAIDSKLFFDLAQQGGGQAFAGFDMPAGQEGMIGTLPARKENFMIRIAQRANTEMKC